LPQTATWRWAPEKWASTPAVFHVLGSDCPQISAYASERNASPMPGPIVIPHAQTAKLTQRSGKKDSEPQIYYFQVAPELNWVYA
jgi:hypothetical protein